MGTLINCLAIIAGGVLGLLAGRFIPEKVGNTVLKANGAAVIALGIAGVMKQMLVIQQGALEVQGTFNMIFSICVGALIGEWIDLEAGLERFGSWLKQKTGSASDANFTDAFLTASLTVSIGAMAIVGSIEDGIHGNPSILISKAILDFMIILLMSASMGKGCVFSFVPVGILQGSVTLLAIGLRGIFTEPALAGLSLTGNVIISLIGVNLLFGKTIKTANLLPALVLSILLTFLLGPGV
ncbi:MAG: DUF554 domain-containing protein [Solobacterium sp.]|nr:DUF554 domain-containing protein [Solobacterium sp.]